MAKTEFDVDSGDLIEAIKASAEEPFVKEIDGKWYTDTDLQRLPEKPLQPAIKVHTLQSIVDYVKGGIDAKALGEFAIVIESPTQVSLLRSLDNFREEERWTGLVATARLPRIAIFDSAELEAANLSLRLGFVDDLDRGKVIESLSNVVSSESLEASDDGNSQKVVFRKGIDQANGTLPNPVNLRPFRTFSEIQQPESLFVLRLRKQGDHQMFASLTCADGEAWVQVACSSIKTWLETELKAAGVEGVPILG